MAALYADGLRRAADERGEILMTVEEFIAAGGHHLTLVLWRCRYGQLHQTPMNKIGLCNKHRNSFETYRRLLALAREHGYKIVTTYDEFMAAGGKMKNPIVWICPAGQRHETSGQKMVCKRHTHALEQYRAFVRDMNAEFWGMISEVTDYDNIHSLTNAMCPRGHQQTKTHDNFNHEHRCAVCVRDAMTTNSFAAIPNCATIGDFQDRVLGLKWCREQFKPADIITAFELIAAIKFEGLGTCLYRPLIEIVGANLYVEVRSPRNASMSDASVMAMIGGAIVTGYDVLVLTFDDMDELVDETLYGGGD